MYPITLSDLQTGNELEVVPVSRIVNLSNLQDVSWPSQMALKQSKVDVVLHVL
jgi:hypothetical protein